MAGRDRKGAERRYEDLDDPGQRAGGTGGVADDAHAVAHDDPLAAQGAGLHRHHPPTVEQQREATTVDGDDAGVDGVVVGGPVLGAGAGAPPRPLVVLVVVLAVAPAHAGPTTEVQKGAKSGKVLLVVSMSSTSTPSTAEPMMTPACAIRWSA